MSVIPSFLLKFLTKFGMNLAQFYCPMLIKIFLLYRRNEVENIETEKEALMRKLVEVEVDGKAAAEEVGKLRDAVRRLKHVSIQEFRK